MKKGEGIIFNWIFITITGTIFLLLFVGFAFKYKDVEEEKMKFQLATSIDNSLDGLQGQNLYTTLDYKQQVNFKADCDNLKVNEYTVPLRDKIVFSESISSKTFHIWVKDFKFPYKITKFYFVADDTQYYLVGDHTLEIPAIFNVEKISLSQVQGKKGKFIFFGDPGAIKNEVEDYIIVKDNTIIYPDNSEVPYFGDLIYGAIFSDKKNYLCNLGKTLERLKTVNAIYLSKASYLSLWAGCSYDMTYFRRVPEFLEREDYLGLEENQKNMQSSNEKFCNEVF